MTACKRLCKLSKAKKMPRNMKPSQVEHSVRSFVPTLLICPNVFRDIKSSRETKRFLKLFVYKVFHDLNLAALACDLKMENLPYISANTNHSDLNSEVKVQFPENERSIYKVSCFLHQHVTSLGFVA